MLAALAIIAYFTVQPGNTLSGIAQHYSTTWQAVYADNRATISDPDLIYPGNVIKVPEPGNTPQRQGTEDSGSAPIPVVHSHVHDASSPSSIALASDGSEIQNGTEVYNYLLRHVFDGSKIAAAGATASIWGESNWNPYAVGTGGRGLIGWTPEGTISDADFSGGLTTQLPDVVQFIASSGDWGVIQQMESATSVDQAAEEWGQGVERYGIDDVHPTGIWLAGQIAGL